jgi:hypothetical protein
MSTTLSTWLGIAFLVLAISSVILQAWLWGPQYWDSVNKRSLAPLRWVRVHRTIGYTYAAIYVFMMWQMVPRLWQYQFELPARSILHAIAAICLGVILVSKIAILRFFRHFEAAMPKFGFGLLLCTVVLTALSVPYAVRAQDLSGAATDPKNLERVERILTELNLGGPARSKQLVARTSLERGRQVLIRKCILCHDTRTILMKPRTGQGWLDIVRRMAEKPSVFGEPIVEDDIAPATAYLVAITPRIQKSLKDKRTVEKRSAGGQAGSGAGGQAGDEPTTEEAAPLVAPSSSASANPTSASANPAVASSSASPLPASSANLAPKPAPKEPPLDKKLLAGIVQTKCTECHELSELDEHGGDTRAGWSRIVRRMVQEHGAELSRWEIYNVARYLAVERPKK